MGSPQLFRCLPLRRPEEIQGDGKPKKVRAVIRRGKRAGRSTRDGDFKKDLFTSKLVSWGFQ